MDPIAWTPDLLDPDLMGDVPAERPSCRSRCVSGLCQRMLNWIGTVSVWLA
jgi:hypothetical protein